MNVTISHSIESCHFTSQTFLRKCHIIALIFFKADQDVVPLGICSLRSKGTDPFSAPLPHPQIFGILINYLSFKIYRSVFSVEIKLKISFHSFYSFLLPFTSTLNTLFFCIRQKDCKRPICRNRGFALVLVFLINNIVALLI